MPYKPITEDPEAAMREHRERLYWLTLASGAVNLVVLMMHLADYPSTFLGPLVGGMCGSLIVAAIKQNTDSYYNDLVAVGLRWMVFALGAIILLLWAQDISSVIDRLVPAFSALETDALLLALILGLMFHTGYAFAYLRDLLTSRGED